MNIVQIQARRIEGVSVRTCNADEAQPSRARIGALWAQFSAQVAPQLSQGVVIYGVYHHYASDAGGAYDLLVGSDAPQKCTLRDTPAWHVAHIQAGPYAVFQVNGPMPQSLIEAWARVWSYFADPHCPYQRAYTSDFEFYAPDGAVDIHIALIAKAVSTSLAIFSGDVCGG